MGKVQMFTDYEGCVLVFNQKVGNDSCFNEKQQQQKFNF
jgi:hypothetical protein